MLVSRSRDESILVRPDVILAKDIDNIDER